MNDYVAKTKELSGKTATIRCCGVLFCQAALGELASFIPLNRNFRVFVPFFRHLWVRALPG